jgi:hypothetical protein
MTNLIAQSSIPLAPPGGFTGFGPLGNITSSAEAVNTFTKFISSTIGIMTIIAVIWFVFIFITGAIAWMGAGGDKNALESAKKKITTGIIGLAVTVVAIFIIDLIGKLIGIPDILNLGLMFALL